MDRITLKIPPSPATMAALGTTHSAPQEHSPCQQRMWETTRRGTRTCTHNNQTDHAEGGVVGDDDDGDDGDDDNDDDGGCGGRDGHHRMRKGRGHDDRTNTTIK